MDVRKRMSAQGDVAAVERKHQTRLEMDGRRSKTYQQCLH